MRMKDTFAAVLPTSGGKSLTYLVPTNLTVIVTPLTALIDDQCHKAKEMGFNAVKLHGETHAKMIGLHT